MKVIGVFGQLIATVQDTGIKYAYRLPSKKMHVNDNILVKCY